jgi:hypothetical protein
MTTIPTLKELYDGIIADLQTEYGTSIPFFGKIFLRALAMVQAGKLKLFYLVLGKLQKNIFIDTAESENSGGTLERFGRIKLGRNPYAAVAGQYQLTVTGSIGATIPASTTFKSNDDSLSPGKLFILDVAYVLVALSDTITVRALEAGVSSKLLVNDKLTATAPIANVDKIATILLEPIAPIDSEDIEDYRDKGIEAYQLEPAGGSPGDYRIWGYDVAGVKKLYPFAKTGYANEINLYIEANAVDSIDGLGTPSAGMLTDVEAVTELDPDITKPIDERGRRPLGVHQIHYLPIVVKEVDIEINGFVGLTPTIEASILSALTTEINKIRPFVAGADVLDFKNDILDVNKIVNIILTVKPGSTFGTVVLKIDGVSLPTFTFSYGDIPHLNSVTYL